MEKRVPVKLTHNDYDIPLILWVVTLICSIIGLAGWIPMMPVFLFVILSFVFLVIMIYHSISEMKITDGQIIIKNRLGMKRTLTRTNIKRFEKVKRGKRTVNIINFGTEFDFTLDDAAAEEFVKWFNQN